MVFTFVRGGFVMKKLAAGFVVFAAASAHAEGPSRESTGLLATGTCENIAANGCDDAAEPLQRAQLERSVTAPMGDAKSLSHRRHAWTTNRTLMVVGGATLAASYFVSVAVVIGTTTCTAGSVLLASCHSYSGWLLLPAVGPVAAFGDNFGKPSSMDGEIAFYSIGALVNIAALTTLLIGALYRPDSDHPTAWRWTITPFSVWSATGIALSGVL